MEHGRAPLREARAAFERGEIPPHPFGGKQWSELPCKWCDFKKYACKPDCKAKVTEMAESNGIAFARETQTDYSFERQKQGVLERWDGKTGVHIRLPVASTLKEKEVAKAHA
jgi:hypothetical protein